MTWKELKDKISDMTEEEQQREVAVWGEDITLHNKDCSLVKELGAMYCSDNWDSAIPEGELEPEDFYDPSVYKVSDVGLYYISI